MKETYDGRKRRNAAQAPCRKQRIRSAGGHVMADTGVVGMNFFDRVYDIVRSIPSGAVSATDRSPFLPETRVWHVRSAGRSTPAPKTFPGTEW